jgi:hypothetical protein
MAEAERIVGSIGIQVVPIFEGFSEKLKAGLSGQQGQTVSVPAGGGVRTSGEGTTWYSADISAGAGKNIYHPMTPLAQVAPPVGASAGGGEMGAAAALAALTGSPVSAIGGAGIKGGGPAGPIWDPGPMNPVMMSIHQGIMGSVAGGKVGKFGGLEAEAVIGGGIRNIGAMRQSSSAQRRVDWWVNHDTTGPGPEAAMEDIETLAASEEIFRNSPASPPPRAGVKWRRGSRMAMFQGMFGMWEVGMAATAAQRATMVMATSNDANQQMTAAWAAVEAAGGGVFGSPVMMASRGAGQAYNGGLPNIAFGTASAGAAGLIGGGLAWGALSMPTALGGAGMSALGALKFAGPAGLAVSAGAMYMGYEYNRTEAAQQGAMRAQQGVDASDKANLEARAGRFQTSLIGLDQYSAEKKKADFEFEDRKIAATRMGMDAVRLRSEALVLSAKNYMNFAETSHTAMISDINQQQKQSDSVYRIQLAGVEAAGSGDIKSAAQFALAAKYGGVRFDNYGSPNQIGTLKLGDTGFMAKSNLYEAESRVSDRQSDKQIADFESGTTYLNQRRTLGHWDAEWNQIERSSKDAINALGPKADPATVRRIRERADAEQMDVVRGQGFESDTIRSDQASTYKQLMYMRAKNPMGAMAESIVQKGRDLTAQMAYEKMPTDLIKGEWKNVQAAVQNVEKDYLEGFRGQAVDLRLMDVTNRRDQFDPQKAIQTIEGLLTEISKKLELAN